MPTSKRDYEKLDEQCKRICQATALGMNYFLQTHPEVKPRLLTTFEPWHVLALNRHLSMEQLYRFAHIDGSMPRLYKEMDAARARTPSRLRPARRHQAMRRS